MSCALSLPPKGVKLPWETELKVPEAQQDSILTAKRMSCALSLPPKGAKKPNRERNGVI